MTVLIKGMEMPDNCESCPFLDYEQGFCFASGTKGENGWYDISLFSGHPKFRTMRNPECPLAPVSPHGRLIDADELKELYTGKVINDNMVVPIAVIRQNIDDMTTIIEAEEDKK